MMRSGSGSPISETSIAGPTVPGAQYLFCSGHAFDGYGRVIFSGGHECHGTGDPANCGIKQLTMYDPLNNTMTDLGDMGNGRWYPTCTLDSDGDMYFISGNGFPSGEPCSCAVNRSIEKLSAGTTPSLSLLLSDIGSGLPDPPLYPRTHRLASGVMAVLAPEVETLWFDPNTPDVTESGIETNLFERRSSCNTVALPVDLRDTPPVQRFLLIGGFTDGEDLPTDKSEIFEQNVQGAWVWTYTNGDMNHARGHADAITLFDRTIFLVGGGEEGPYTCPILTPEIFDPATETWTEGPNHDNPRMYHSTVALQRDGSVWVAGQDQASGTCGEITYSDTGATVEIFRPWYCSDTERPEITAIDASSRANPFERNETFDVTYSLGQNRTFEYVAILGLTSRTHSLGTEQGYMILDNFTPVGNTVEVDVPAAVDAPPGVYMLIVVDNTDSPSIAEFIYLGF